MRILLLIYGIRRKYDEYVNGIAFRSEECLECEVKK